MPTKCIEPINEAIAESESILSTSSLGQEMQIKSEVVLKGGYNIPLKGQEAILDGSSEESFTLETFENLIKAAFMKNKAFIIARVTTADPHDHLKIYHSYYAAHHINKVLFRTQPELGLLHRMKSKNPLNNMAIIGDVDYFAITTASVEQSLKEVHMDIKKKDFSRGTSKIKSKHKRTLSDSVCSNQEDRQYSFPKITLNSQEEEVEVTDSMKDLKVTYTAQFFASDDDYLMKTEIREYFKANSANPDDYMLFTLYPADDERYRQGQDGGYIPEIQTAPRRPAAKCSNLFGCINTRPTPSLTNRYTGFLTSRGLAIFFLLYIGAAVASLKFLIPLSYVYLAGFLFAFCFVLVLVLFAEAGPSR